MRLEDFLSENLHLIDSDLTIIKRQYVLNDTRKYKIGVLDIFSQYEDGRYCGIECKVQKMTARDLGQCLGYWGYWYGRCETLNLPPPIIYCVGPAVDPIFEYGMKALSDLSIIKTLVYEFPLGHGPNDEKWEVDLIPFDEDFGRLRIRR